MQAVFRICLFSLLCIVTIGCKKQELEPCNSILPQPDCVCNFLYDPVCGCDGVTYPNACAAECSSIFNYKKGKCKD